MKRNLIAIHGKSGSGKDTVANIINDLTDNVYEIHKFADAVKEVSSILSGINIKDFYNRTNKYIDHLNVDMRKLQQLVGTDIFRSYDEDIWIKVLFKDYDFKKNWMITDLRFKNEMLYLQRKNAYFIKVVSDKASLYDHQSENDLDFVHDNSYDIVIFNNGTLKDLEDYIKRMIIPKIL